MAAKQPRSYQLSSALVASSVGAGAVCLAPAGMGRTYRLHASRPGPERNRFVTRADIGADLPSGAAHVIAPVAPPLTRVDISGPLEQRAGYHDPCGGWTDGHDAIAERLCAAFASGDVLLVVDSPGGAAAGLQQSAARALKAKLHHGRRVVVFADEMIGSAAMWWTSVLGDELFLPEAGQVGSIGARGGHESIAGLLEKEGRAVTYFTWPNDGKIAFAPELPLGEIGKARGTRDVSIAGEAFCAAVCGGAIGLRYKLDRDGVIALGADMLTGANAVGILADGVATLEEVTAYALSLAELGPVKSAATSSARVRARGDRNMPKIKAEDEKDARARAEDAPDKEAAGDDAPPSSQPEGAPSSRKPEAEEGRDIPTKCGSCGVENPKEAKYCMGCSASMGTQPIESTDEPPASDPAPPKPGASARALTTSASFEEILGLPRGASLPAQKAAALGWRRVMVKVAAMTGRTDPDEQAGALTAIEKDAAATGRIRAERNALKTQIETSERLSLAHRLVAAGEPRGRVFVDVIKDGKRAGVKLSPMYAEMRLGILRGEVEAREPRKATRNPFEPSKADAIARSNAARGGEADRDARVEAAKALPAVRKLAQQSGRDLAVVAAEWVNVESGAAAIGGVQ